MANLKEQAHRFYETIDRQDWPGLARLVAPGFVSQVGSATHVDFFEWQSLLRTFFAGFPDGHHVHDYYEAEGDRVVTIGRFEGTQTGTFAGVPPSGSTVSVGVIHVDRFVVGKLVEHCGQLDSLGLTRQLARR